jgi:light-regulated signal transduction histidine kinase (bacteriophytochrome)
MVTENREVGGFSLELNDGSLTEMHRKMMPQFFEKSNEQNYSTLLTLLSMALLILALTAARIYTLQRLIKKLTTDLDAEIAQRRQLASKLNRALHDLEHHKTELNDFAYATSHYLREPLRSISGFLQMLEQRYGDVLDERGWHYIETSVKSTHQMNDLLEDMYTYTRQVQVEIQRETVDLAQLVDEAHQVLNANIEESGAHIRTESLPTILADRSAILELLQNLLSNAIKFRRPGVTPEVVISARPSLSGETGWWITVSDNGIGIEPQYQKKIFQIFLRLHARHEYSGTGMGLAICRKIVDNHCGHILVDSEPGRGSRFHIFLPQSSDNTA